MQFDEDVMHKWNGIVVGCDTGRVIAKFSHEAEAEAFCLTVNTKSLTDNGVEKLRDAANVALGHLTGGIDGDWRDCDPVDLLREALERLA